MPHLYTKSGSRRFKQPEKGGEWRAHAGLSSRNSAGGQTGSASSQQNHIARRRYQKCSGARIWLKRLRWPRATFLPGTAGAFVRSGRR
jgi:hypothetical protein